MERRVQTNVQSSRSWGVEIVEDENVSNEDAFIVFCDDITFTRMSERRRERRKVEKGSKRAKK